MSRKRTVSIKALAAPADGIAPALLVSVGQGILGVRSMANGLTLEGCLCTFSLLLQTPPQAQYLINVPEGVSKLALEHKCRPDASLKAAICLGSALESSVRVFCGACCLMHGVHLQRCLARNTGGHGWVAVAPSRRWACSAQYQGRARHLHRHGCPVQHCVEQVPCLGCTTSSPQCSRVNRAPV